MNFKHQFVDQIPEILEDTIIYVCIPHDICIHHCACGCGEEVVTPLSPHDWKLGYNGKTISLSPSIGNWSFACQSHYWIKNGYVEWAGRLTDQEIREGRELDARNKEITYSKDAPGWYERLLSFLRISK